LRGYKNDTAADEAASERPSSGGRELQMKLTHNRAIEALANGNPALAWKLAQQDEGLLPTVTRDEWMAFAGRIIASRFELFPA